MDNDNLDTGAADSKPMDDERIRYRRRMSSAELFGPAREIVIEHGSNEYRLRVTSNDKLILTK